MRNGIRYIVGAGENDDLYLIVESKDHVIVADDGLSYLKQSDIKADLAIGDFDTLHYKPDQLNVITLSEEKDDPDRLGGLRKGTKKSCSTFSIYYGMGGRVEHILANLQLLVDLFQRKQKGFLF